MEPPAPRPTCETFYNGSCPVCSTEIGHYRRSRGGSDLGWRDIAREPEALAAHGISADQAIARLHALDGEGRLHVGVDAFLLLWRSLPGYGWLARLVGSRPVKPLAVLIYERVLAPWLARRHRRRLADPSRPG